MRIVYKENIRDFFYLDESFSFYLLKNFEKNISKYIVYMNILYSSSFWNTFNFKSIERGNKTC